MRTLVIGNLDDADVGVIGERLEARGARLHPVWREHSAGWPDDTRTADALLVLGSVWSVYWDSVAEHVRPELALLADAHARGVPILGICFGAQALAAALGGSVRRADHHEVGWMTVDSTDPRIEAGPWMQFHFDTFVPPPGADVLATSPVGPQAFVVGRTMAVQFHPEVDVAIIERWMDEGSATLAEIGLAPDELRAATAANAPRSRLAAHRLVDTFLDEVAAGMPVS